MELNEFFYLILPSFVIGLCVSGIYHLVRVYQLKRTIRSMDGLLESDKLVKETLRKENTLAFSLKETMEQELNAKLKEALDKIRIMDSDILLLQMSNEQTEAEFKAAQPEIYELKLKLIEAHNTISRLKKQLLLSQVAA